MDWERTYAPRISNTRTRRAKWVDEREIQRRKDSTYVFDAVQADIG
jgi:hypothetical protein